MEEVVPVLSDIVIGDVGQVLVARVLTSIAANRRLVLSRQRARG